MSAIILNEKREIVIDLSWLLGALSAENKRELVDSLACEEAIIEDVASQLLDGWTERSSRGARSGATSPEPTTALDRARRKLAIGADDIAKDEIEQLKRALICSKVMEEHYSRAYFAAYHAWAERAYKPCPALGQIPLPPDTAYTVVKKAAP